MNYLAHLYIADSTNTSLIGNFLGDFVKGNLTTQYNEEILIGIRMHRQVDLYTDSHPKVLNAKSVMSTKRRRFSGIILDMAFDHFLAKHWATYSDISLTKFAHQFYMDLETHLPLLPDRVQHLFPYMKSYNWLTSYEHMEGIHASLNGISKRMKRENLLLNSSNEIVKNYSELEDVFFSFFEDLISYSRKLDL